MFPGIYFLQPVLLLKVFPHFPMILRVCIHQWSNPKMWPEPFRSNPHSLLNATALDTWALGGPFSSKPHWGPESLPSLRFPWVDFPTLLKEMIAPEDSGNWSVPWEAPIAANTACFQKLLFEVTKHTLKAESNYVHISKCWFCGSANTLWLSSFPMETFPTITWWRRVDS